MRARWPLVLFALIVPGCSALTPFPTSPLAAEPNVKDPGPRVAICYSPFKTPDEKVQELAQAECIGDATAEKVSTDYRLDGCPAFTPARATFVCKPKPKQPETPPAAGASPPASK
jgi:hypothetical protein